MGPLTRPFFSLGLRASLGAIFGGLHHQVIGVLATIMDDPKVAAAARVAATNAILDRGWGKPPFDLDHSTKATSLCKSHCN
jgi:hypothetical protein